MLGTLQGVLRSGLAVSETALGAALTVVRGAHGLLDGQEEHEPEPRWDDFAAPPAPPEERPEPGPHPAPEADEPVDEGVVLTAEYGEEGAEDGAGAEVDVQEPWDGYDSLQAPDVIRTLNDASRETLAAVDLYEREHRGRQTVIETAERLLERAGPTPD